MRTHLALTAALLGVGACFSPTYQEGLACSESGECPGDLECIAQECVAPGSSITPDADRTPTADAQPGEPDAESCLSGSQTFEATGTIDSFTVPDCITSITIEAFGAEGGGGVDPVAVPGGKGARMKGDFAVTEGDVLQILVGVRGADAVQLGGDPIGEQGGGSGGGGTFVVDASDNALIVAGGGGGATNNTIVTIREIPGGDGTIELGGQSGSGANGGAGGVDGGGGAVEPNGGFHRGTGGGGFSGDGVGQSNGLAQNGTPNSPGTAFLNGGAGGVAGSAGRNGGFGGGGSAGFTGGGGGGYSGGGAGGDPSDSTHGGGGGGSINTGTNQDNSPGVRIGNGQVVITWDP